MSIKVMIPASSMIDIKNTTLLLDSPQSCSRCDQLPADFFESHRLKFRAGYQKTHIFGKKYKVENNYTLKIRVCETCYQADYLTNPEMLDRDATTQGRIAKFHSIAWTLGGLLAAAGFLLLTPIIPDTPALKPFKDLWQAPVAVGVLVLFLTWLSQRKQQSLILHALDSAGKDIRSYSRAEVRTPILADENDLSAVALEIKFDNEVWAMETAAIHHWLTEKITSSDQTVSFMQN
ncbi:MAG: Uncharacterized protein FD147_307 [Chloroflexi bacterium]|nr:MAG: Uncharacterized protein FD147_307 [Chloroflexota bacterium]MBA4375280.1 hypothetical protein [Anaerolinea sp.]